MRTKEFAVGAFASLTLLTGCGGGEVPTNPDAIGYCGYYGTPDGSNVEPTYDTTAPNYEASKDPYVLLELLQEQNTSPDEEVGISMLVCQLDGEDESDKQVLTQPAIQLGRTLIESSLE